MQRLNIKLNQIRAIEYCYTWLGILARIFFLFTYLFIYFIYLFIFASFEYNTYKH